jgi:predicted nucleotidyltransferase
MRSKEWTSEFLDSAQTDPNVIAVIAVGSAVRKSVPSVDVDLVVICKDPRSLNASPPIEVDLRSYSSSGLDVRVEGRNDMLIWAILFGKALFQRNRFWDEFVDSWKGRLPLPSIETAQKRAVTASRRLIKVLMLGDEDAVLEQALSYFTHLARIQLLQKGVYPASRPELPGQLRSIGESQLAQRLEELYYGKVTGLPEIANLLKTLAPSLDYLRIELRDYFPDILSSFPRQIS